MIMMTKEEKDRRIKILLLILIVEMEYLKRKPFKNWHEAMSRYIELVFWSAELAKVAKRKTFEKGHAVVGETHKQEIFIPK